MRNFQNNFKRMFSNYKAKVDMTKFLKGPITKIIGINTVLYLAWNMKGVSEQFLVKHFSYERFNIREHRYHTLFTHAFSHFSFLSFIINSLVMASFGRHIVAHRGARTLWIVYLGGAFSGGLFMQLFKPYNSIIVPEVGAGPAVSAVIAFYGIRNLQSSVILLVFPMKMYVLLGFMGVMCLIEPSKKDLGGMLTGMALSYVL